jgi:hypothetical protein
MSPDYEAAALGHAEAGRHVFPCRPGDKQPLKIEDSVAKFVNGFKSATRDERKILHAWDRYPNANIGIACGASAIVALDVDTKAGADPLTVLSDLEIAPDHPIVWTGRAPAPSETYPHSLEGKLGCHVYFRGQVDKRATTAIPGVGLWGAGAYLLGPPSLHPSGVHYCGDLPAMEDMPEITAALVDALGAPERGESEAPGDGEEIPEGNRHRGLFDWAMRHLVGRGVLGERALEAMIGHNALYVRPPLPEAEVRKLWRDVEGTDAAARARAEAAEGEKSEAPKKSQATRLIALVREHCELWHTPDDEPVATVDVGGHREHHPLRSRPFRRWAAQLYFEANGSALGAQGLADAAVALEGVAVHSGDAHQLHVRLAEHGGRTYLDLGNRDWQAVEVSPAGWRVTAAPPVRFRHPTAMLPLPAPVTGGRLTTLRDFLNVPDDRTWRLLAAWLLGALSPRGPYPILTVHGEQGSAKSTASRLLRALVDPNKAMLRSAPREERDLIVAASHSWVTAFDNVSTVPDWFSDGLCRLATGGGYAARTLYTDADETVLDVQRPVLLNGIGNLGTRGDLLDRSIVTELEALTEGHRSERELWAAFYEARPAILGALLDVVSAALGRASDGAPH